ncbi:MAG: hypothetical protein ACI8R9_001265 [Paraglaciecola sp.]|jgi:hypothetical protein
MSIDVLSNSGVRAANNAAASMVRGINKIARYSLMNITLKAINTDVESFSVDSLFQDFHNNILFD